MKQRLGLVDFLKGYSIFTIVVMHLVQGNTGVALLDKALSFGGAGVHVFILCSGFGLYLSCLRKPMNYGRFLKRRFTKIYLPYIAVVLLSAVLPFYCADLDKVKCVLSHLFLYKMFFEEYEASFGGQMWFMSTIIQFYICWPLIVRAFERLSGKRSLLAALAVSLIWATVVGLLGKEELRIWGSFFLQYMWEFVLGMYLARRYSEDAGFIKLPSFKLLLPMVVVCMLITGYAGMKGGVLKLYNDVPSMLAYLGIALILYKLKFANRLFVFTNGFSYEWYLTHILTFACVGQVCRMSGCVESLLAPILLAEFIASYAVAWLYGKVLGKVRLK